jgi:cell division protein FtsB
VGAPIKGSDNLPLKGSEKLLVNFQNDVNDVVKFEQQIVTRRKDFEKISKEVTRTEERLRSMTDIRDSVQAEKFFLETFEVNVYETRETVFRRKRQLVGRLGELGMKIGE